MRSALHFLQPILEISVGVLYISNCNVKVRIKRRIIARPSTKKIILLWSLLSGDIEIDHGPICNNYMEPGSLIKDFYLKKRI